jgi:hypothetical protein
MINAVYMHMSQGTQQLVYKLEALRNTELFGGDAPLLVLCKLFVKLFEVSLGRILQKKAPVAILVNGEPVTLYYVLVLALAVSDILIGGHPLLVFVRVADLADF